MTLPDWIWRALVFVAIVAILYLANRTAEEADQEKDQ